MTIQDITRLIVLLTFTEYGCRPEHEKKCFGRQFFYVSNESKSVLAHDLGICCNYRILFFIIGPTIIAMIIFTRSAGMNGITQTARAAWKV